MSATMMDYQLSVNHLVERAGSLFADTEIISIAPSKERVVHTYRDVLRRSRGLAKALIDAGLQPGERVATLMWNHHAHLETYYGAPMAGGVYHTLNLRLAPTDIAYIVNHAQDRFLIVDDSLFGLYQAIRDQISPERVFVVRWNDSPVPEGVEDYEAFVQGGIDDAWEAPPVDENQAAGMCYTSGTTGRPKGVVYSHRALVLHSLASGQPDMLNISCADTLLPVVPMFHANAWGLAFTAAMAGARQVHPGPHLDPLSLLKLYADEKVTVSAGVPTIWMGILKELQADASRWDLPKSMRMIVGGSAVPESLIRGMDAFGMRIRQAWGMTETAPLGTVGSLKGGLLTAPEDEQIAARSLQGFSVPYVELRIQAEGKTVANDGVSMGELQVRGPWVASSYYNAPEKADNWTEDGWFRTGDVSTISPDGYMKITDRTKDLIKSGGEWISSVDLENALMAHPSIAEAAVVATPHPKWRVRPLAAIVRVEGHEVHRENLNAYLAEQFARYWLPDGYVVLDEIPRNSTGKFMKMKLRQDLAEWKPVEGDPGAPGDK